MEPSIVEILKKVTLILAFATITVWLIHTFFVKKQGRADLGGILYVVMVTLLIAGYPHIIAIGSKLGSEIGNVFNSDGRYIVTEYFDEADSRMAEIGGDLDWDDIAEKIGLMYYWVFSKMVRMGELVFYSAQKIMLDLIAFVAPLMIAMSLYESHRGKLSFIFGWTLQICLWAATWVFGAAVAKSIILGISNPEYLTIPEAVAAAFLWMVFLPVYSLGGIFVIQKLYTLGAQGAASSLGLGNVGAAAAVAMRFLPGGAVAGAAMSAINSSRESLNGSKPGQAINGAPKAAGQKVKEGAGRLLSSVRRGGVIMPVNGPPEQTGGFPRLRMKRR